MLDLKGYNAVITGASGGFGFEMAKTLLSCGANVAVSSRPGEKLENAVKSLENEGYSPVCLPMDVRDEASAEKAAQIISERWGRIDMLVNNAGLGTGRVNSSMEPIDFFQINPEAFRDVVNTNFIGYFLTARSFVPLMIKQGKGQIVNVSTSIPTMTREGQIPYGPARAAAEAFSVILSKELKKYSINVNVILPGGASRTGLIPEAFREEYEKRGDLLGADILNRVILFLASPLAENLNGERIIAKEFDVWLNEKGMKLPF